MTMTLIETKTLGTAASAVEFTSVPQTFTDLFILTSARNTGSSVFFRIELNGSTSNFTNRYLVGSGTSVVVGSESFAPFSYLNPSSWTANTFSNGQFYIPNYSGNTNKSISVDSVSENNATAADQALVAGLWSQTAAITSVGFRTGANNFEVGSIFSLYGILKGSSGGVVVS